MDTTIATTLFYSDNSSLEFTNNETSSANFSNILTIPGPYGIAMTVLGTVGTFTNGVTIQILLNEKFPVDMKILLVALTTMDLFYCLGNIPKMFIDQYISSPGWKLLFYAVAVFGRGGSTIMTLILTIERYSAVCKPIKHRTWWTPTKIIIILIFAMIINVIYNIPLFHFNLMRFYNTMTKEAVKFYTIVGISILIGEIIITAFIVIFFNYKIFREIKWARIRRRKLTHKLSTSSADSQSDMFTRITQIVVFCFFFLHTVPRILVLVCFAAFLSKNTGIQLYYYLNIFFAVNCSINCIIYCAVAKKFRQKYVQYITCNNITLS